MKKKIITSLMLALGLLIQTGCGSSADSEGNISTGEEALSDAVYTNDNVSLAAYTGLSAEKNVYSVSDSALSDAIDDALVDYIEYPSVDRASQEGDWIDTDYTVTVSGEVTDEEEAYIFIIGENEFGEEFDEHLTGVSKGDKLEFTIDYDEDYDDSDWAGNSVTFSVTINDVEIKQMPDETDEFARESLGYDTYDEFVEATRASLESEYESESEDELRENLLQQVIDASVLLQYTQADYDSAYADVESFYQNYADTFGVELDEIYEAFEIDDDSLETDTKDMLKRNLVIQAIAENENITVSDDKFDEAVEEYMEEYEYTSKEDFISDYGEDSIRSLLQENMVLEFLEENADITEVEADYDAE